MRETQKFEKIVNLILSSKSHTTFKERLILLKCKNMYEWREYPDQKLIIKELRLCFCFVANRMVMKMIFTENSRKISIALKETKKLYFLRLFLSLFFHDHTPISHLQNSTLKKKWTHFWKIEHNEIKNRPS